MGTLCFSPVKIKCCIFSCQVIPYCFSSLIDKCLKGWVKFELQQQERHISSINIYISFGLRYAGIQFHEVQTVDAFSATIHARSAYNRHGNGYRRATVQRLWSSIFSSAATGNAHVELLSLMFIVADIFVLFKSLELQQVLLKQLYEKKRIARWRFRQLLTAAIMLAAVFIFIFWLEKLV